MKRLVYFVVILLVLCVSAVSLAKYMDSERDGHILNDGVISSNESPPNSPRGRELPTISPNESISTANDFEANSPSASNSEVSHTQVRNSSEDILLVNPENPLPDDYRPENLVNLYDQKNKHFQLARADIKICETVFEAMNAMFAAAQQDGIKGFIITSGYRSHEEQKEVFASSANGIAANPGESEHETGLAFDVTAMGNENFELTPQFEWLSQHCAEYGFIIRYPKGLEDVTGFPYESWHYRYVGTPYAEEIMEQGLTLEEYLAQR